MTDRQESEIVRLRHEVADLIRAHQFSSSRPWPDGSKPEAPDWNPGCSCGASLYYFEHDLHLADAILALVIRPAGEADRGEWTGSCRTCAEAHPADGCADIGCQHNCEAEVSGRTAYRPGGQ